MGGEMEEGQKRRQSRVWDEGKINQITLSEERIDGW